MSNLLKNKKLLVVEDAQPILQIVKTVLKTVGAQSTGVKSVAQAKALIEEKQYDAVILDRYLEEEDGHTLLKYLKSNKKTKTIPVVMLSGEKDMAEIKTSVSLGVDGYIVKPFSAKKFLDQLEKILRRSGVTGFDFK